MVKQDIVRGCGLIVRSIIQAQTTSPDITPVYAALVAHITALNEQVAEAIIKKLIALLLDRYEMNDKVNCLSTLKFISHLVNQDVVCII